MDKKHALVLAGGGSRGSYQIGVWQALRELDWRIDLVTGTSVGALNGAMIVQDSFEDALLMWNRLETGMVLDMDQDAINQMKKGLIGTIGVFAKELIIKGGAGYSSLQEIVNDFVDEEKVRSSPCGLGIVTVEMLTLAPHNLFKEEIEPGKLRDYLLASAACFPAFHCYEIDHVKYIDGGYSDNMPIQMALDQGAEEIIAVDLNAVGIVNKSLISLPQVTRIQCSWDLGNFLLFDQSSARHNIRLGYLDTMKAFHVFDGRSYAFARDAFKRLIRWKKEGIHRVLSAAGANFSTTSRSSVDHLRRLILQKNIAYYTGGGLNLENLLLTCAESAGRIFEMDPENIYTLQSFDQQLQKKRDASLTALRQELGESFPNIGRMGLDKLPAFFRNWNSKAITLGLSAVLQSWLQNNATGDFVPLATLFPKEFAAAFYLTVLGLAKEKD